jgi:aminobenzoyl-glutamate transport protein
MIPYFPFSGNFLNYSEKLYIDKLFGANSFFADGFVFVITILFIIWGLLYGIGSKSIKNNREFIDSLGYSLNGVGKTLVFIFASATLISIFKYSNIGNTITAFLTNLVADSGFSGLALVLLLFFASMITTLFVPTSVLKWEIMSSQIVPIFLNAGLSAEFCQTIFRFGESVTIGLTPIFAYFVVYMAYLERYNQDRNDFGLRNAIKYQLPYAIATFVILLVIIILWYILSLPLGFGGLVYL